MTRAILFALAGALGGLLLGCGVPAVKKTEISVALEVPNGKNARPIQYRQIVVGLRRGEVFGKVLAGILCLPQYQGFFVWKNEKSVREAFTKVFGEELQKYNYPIVGDPDARFEDPSEWKAELLVVGTIQKMEANICYPRAGFGNVRSSKGQAWIRVNWQIYSRLDRKVIHEVSTEGSFESEQEQEKEGGSFDFLYNAFGVSVQNLLADTDFQKLIIRDYARSSSPTPPPSGGAKEILVN